MLKPLGLARINKMLFFTILISIILYFGREFFVLITFSGLLAMLMTPISNRLERRGVHRGISSALSVLMLVIVIIVVVVLLYYQVTNIGKELPKIRVGLQELTSSFQSWVNDSLGISSEKLKDKASDALSGAGTFITGFVRGFITLIGRFILVLVFTFLFLLQRDKYENFVLMLYSDSERAGAQEMLKKIRRVAQQYLIGRLIAVFIMDVLYIIGFSIIGLKNGILLSAIAAIITIIPYVGALIGGMIPFFMTIIDGYYDQSIAVIVVVLIVNVIDHYFIEPYVVGGSVSISPLFTILILILGGVVWGVAGIILFLPLLGILKIVFENVEGLHPYAYLIGDQSETSAADIVLLKFKRLFSRKKKD